MPTTDLEICVHGYPFCFSLVPEKEDSQTVLPVLGYLLAHAGSSHLLPRRSTTATARISLPLPEDYLSIPLIVPSVFILGLNSTTLSPIGGREIARNYESYWTSPKS